MRPERQKKRKEREKQREKERRRKSTIALFRIELLFS
jgi:hypothetical protein